MGEILQIPKDLDIYHLIPPRMVTPPRLLMFRAQRARFIDWARGNHCLTSVVRKRKGPKGKP